MINFAVPKQGSGLLTAVMVNVAQSVRAPDCGSGGRGFESRLSPGQWNPRKGISFLLTLLIFLPGFLLVDVVSEKSEGGQQLFGSHKSLQGLCGHGKALIKYNVGWVTHFP